MCVSVCVCVGRGELCCLGAYLLQEMEARHAKRWRGDAADSHRQTDRQNQRLTISLSSVTSSAGALTLHLLRLHHLREKPSPLCETDVSRLTAEQNAHFFG